MEDQEKTTGVISLWNWVLTLFLTSIPGVNVISLIYWSVSKRTNKSKTNYARASLLFIILVSVIYLIFVEIATGYFLINHN